MRKITTEEFISKARAIHGDKYDYSKVVYINNSTKVCIICSKHGEFWQQPNNHLQHKGCKDCAREQIKKKIFNIAINDYDGKIWDNVKGKMIPSYIAWMSILSRCYSKSYQHQYKTYIGCSVCDEWLYFSNFKLWYDANCIDGWHIDKDILFKGNKIYSPQTCCCVPPEINVALTNSKSKRGKNLIGVHEYMRGRFVSTYHKKYLGTSGSEKEIFLRYKFYKEQDLRRLAEKYKNQIKENVYNALLNYQVEEGD